jgi:hypothetical protein
MQLQIPIKADEFVWTALEERSRAEQVDLGQLVAQASAYYVSELGGGRTATKVPRLGGGERGESRTVTLELDAAALTRLQEEAERQEVTLDRVLTHATLLYLADEDAGRVAERIARRAQAESDEPA